MIPLTDSEKEILDRLVLENPSATLAAVADLFATAAGGRKISRSTILNRKKLLIKYQARSYSVDDLVLLRTIAAKLAVNGRIDARDVVRDFAAHPDGRPICVVSVRTRLERWGYNTLVPRKRLVMKRKRSNSD